MSMLGQIQAKIPTYEYRVEYASGESVKIISVQAAYLTEEGRLVLFKDAGHSTVFAVAAGMLLSVERRDVTEK